MIAIYPIGLAMRPNRQHRLKAAKTPATIEDLCFTYPNIRDSQHAPAQASGRRIARQKPGVNDPLQNFSASPTARN
jgi:hypothetical protein